MLNVFRIVIQQFANVRYHGALIGIIERNQRRWAGVLICFCWPEYQTRAIGRTFTGRLILRRVSTGNDAMLWIFPAPQRSTTARATTEPRCAGAFRLFSSWAVISSG